MNIKRLKGFTVLELIIVVMLISILMVTADFDFSNEVVGLKAQAEQLQDDIRFTQALAMQRGQRYRINFSATHYSITNINNTSTINHPGTQGQQYNLPTGITLNVGAELVNSFVGFDGLGTPYISSNTPGTPLTANTLLTLTKGSDSIQVQITPETGWCQIL